MHSAYSGTLLLPELQTSQHQAASNSNSVTVALLQGFPQAERMPLLYCASYIAAVTGTQVLQYHVIPSGAILSSQLTDGQQVTTTLAGAAPLTVRISNGQVRFEAVNNSAIVIVPDIKAGASVVHVINDVLLPAPTQAPAAAATPAPTGTPSPAATAANETAPVPAPPTTTEAAASPAPATTESPAAATTTSPVPAVSETYPSSISAESPSPAATTATNVSAVSPSPSATVVSTPPVGAAASPAP